MYRISIKTHFARAYAAVARGFCPPITSAANKAPLETFEAVANGTEVVDTEDGYMRLVRYGDHPHPDVGTQHFEYAQAATITERFHSAANKIKRLIFGDHRIPVYRDHPDVPVFAAQGDDDHTVYAQVEDLEPRSDGLYGKVTWTEAGNALRQAGKKLYFSPYWLLRKAGEATYPFKLISLGLTPTPNILGSAANSNPEHHLMKDTLIKLLKALGFSSEQATAAANQAADAPVEDAILAKANSLQASANSFWDAIGAMLRAFGFTEDEITKLDRDEFGQPTVDDLTARIRRKIEGMDSATASANARIEELETQVKTERRARATLAVANAIREKRIAEADRDKEIEALAGAEDFTAAANALLQRDPVLPSSSKTAGMGVRKGEVVHTAAEKAADKLMAAANQLMAEGQLDWDSAWLRAKEANPALVAAANSRD